MAPSRPQQRLQAPGRPGDVGRIGAEAGLHVEVALPTEQYLSLLQLRLDEEAEDVDARAGGAAVEDDGVVAVADRLVEVVQRDQVIGLRNS